MHLIIFKGFMLGTTLQLAIGPVFLYVFKMATEVGLLAAQMAVLAATLADSLFVLLAIFGVGALLKNKYVKRFLQLFGASVLFYFGIAIVTNAFGIQIMPCLNNVAVSQKTQMYNSFLTSFLLTVSSPLSIIFWTGVFAVKIEKEIFDINKMLVFGLGAVLATLFFLGIFAYLAWLLSFTLNSQILTLMNLLVGIVIATLGVRMLLRKI